MQRPPDVLIPLLSLLEQRVGLRLHGSAMQALGAFEAMAQDLSVGAEELLERLMRDPALLEELATRLTIPETHFFRIGPQIQALIDPILPDLERRLVGTRPLAFWSAGCSTGEEAYTLAILADQRRRWRGKLTILGTDLHPASLEVARRGSYGEWSFRDTPEDVRETYFTQVPREPSAVTARDHGIKWQIAPHLRQMVRFQTLNLLNADWSQLERFDLILCRNVMIYFSNPTAQQLIERLAAQLHPGGWLMVGPSDPPPLPSTLERSGLSVRFESGAILYQKQQLNLPLVIASSSSVPTLEWSLFGAPPDSSDPPAPPDLSSQRQQALATEADFEQQLQLGMNALEALQMPAALAALRRAVYLEPQSALAQFLLAQALVGSGQLDRARVALRQAKHLLGHHDPQSDLHRAITALGVMMEAS
jgi:chemotaxis protein methyltransferase CheR